MGRVGGAGSPAGRVGETSSAPARGKKQPYRVFISHSSADTWVAQVIGEKIVKLGAAVRLDAKDTQSAGHDSTENRRGDLPAVVGLPAWFVNHDRNHQPGIGRGSEAHER